MITENSDMLEESFDHMSTLSFFSESFFASSYAVEKSQRSDRLLKKKNPKLQVKRDMLLTTYFKWIFKILHQSSWCPSKNSRPSPVCTVINSCLMVQIDF